jgi:aryl-alcohol dehydrogenase-like predicted oxidoreductase
VPDLTDHPPSRKGQHVRRRVIPNTEIAISEISFGAGTAAGIMLSATAQEQIRTVARALEIGINHFDTSPIYGDGRSEVNLGQALKAAGAEVVLTTKVNVAPEHLLLSADGAIARGVRKTVHASLSRLQRDHIDILLLHNATGFGRDLSNERLPHLSLDDIFGPGGVWAEVESLVAEGKVRAFGLSGQDNVPEALMAAAATGRIAIFNQPFNLLNPTAAWPGPRVPGGARPAFLRDFEIDYSGVMEFARRQEVGVSVISPVAAGVLTDSAQAGVTPPEVSGWRVRFPRPGQYEHGLRSGAVFAEVARAHGMGMTELAYRFALSQPAVTTVVGGFSNIAQLDEIAAFADAPALDAEALADVTKAASALPDMTGDGE